MKLTVYLGAIGLSLLACTQLHAQKNGGNPPTSENYLYISALLEIQQGTADEFIGNYETSSFLQSELQFPLLVRSSFGLPPLPTNGVIDVNNLNNTANLLRRQVTLAFPAVASREILTALLRGKQQYLVGSTMLLQVQNLVRSSLQIISINLIQATHLCTNGVSIT